VAKTLSAWKEYIINLFITIPDALTKPLTMNLKRNSKTKNNIENPARKIYVFSTK
jgi:hypothetical protein